MERELTSPAGATAGGAGSAAGAGMRGRRRGRGGGRVARERWMVVLSPLGLLILWEIAAKTGVLDSRFFPAPSSIASTFGSMISSGQLPSATLITLRRLGLGLALGGVPGLAIGLMMGVWRPFRVVIDPLVAATFPVPRSAILPLLLLIFGLGDMSKIVLIATGVIYPVLMNTMTGVLQIKPIYHDVGRSFGASHWQRFRTIALPGALPVIFTGLRLAVGIGVILVITAEMLSGNDGLGYLIWNSWQIFAVGTMYVGLVVSALLGVVLTLVVNEMERVVIPWRRDLQAG